MKHSLLRNRNEKVKLFSHKSSTINADSLKVYKFDDVTGITDVTPNYTINSLNAGYYSTEITTPIDDCYLLILFNFNPIVLRVGIPSIKFIYWSKINKIESYKHYDEFGDLVSEGSLKLLDYGFSYYKPDVVTLGYIEINNNPYLLSVPYAYKGGVVALVDWNKKIIKQEFGIKSTKLNFKLNTIKNTFNINTIKSEFDVKTYYKEFFTTIIKQKFKVFCK